MADSENIVLDIRNLSRNYGDVAAVKDVSFHVKRGEIFGLLGPDGAGKSSTMNLFMGLLKPDKGSITFLDKNILNPREAALMRTKVGYMAQGLGLILTPNLSVAENIDYFADMYQIPQDERKRMKDDLFERLYLHPFNDRLAKNLSGGMKQKLALCCTLIYSPDVIVLDEPTTGVDPVSRREFWIVINELVVDKNITVIFATSYMDEAERCHRVALMNEGSIVSMGTVEELKSPLDGRMYEFKATPQKDAIKILKNSGEFESVQPFGERVNLIVKTEGKREVTSMLEPAGIKVEEFQPIEPALENVFTGFLEKSAKESQGGREEQDVEGLFSTVPAWVESSDYNYCIEIEKLLKQFGSFKAVNEVSLSIRKGEVFGFLGPNGAGKTTTIKLLCGLYPPTSGTGRVAGFDIRTEQMNIRKHIGYMSQKFSLYQDMTVAENLELYAGIYGVSRKDLIERRKWTLELAELVGLDNMLTRDIPMGIRQKLALGTCLLHRPDIVFLDEPTSGVDPLARRRFWEIIHQISSIGVSVMVSTHYMDEAEQCDRVSLMHRGFLIAVGTPAEMKKHVAEQSGYLMELSCTNPMKGFQKLKQDFPNVNIYGKKLLFYTKNMEEGTGKAEAILNQAGIKMINCREKRIIFEDVFMYYIENSGIE